MSLLTAERALTYLFSQHIPFEFWQIFHGPDVVPPTRAFLPAYGPSIEHGSDRPRDALVHELDPSLCVMRFFRGRIFAP